MAAVEKKRDKTQHKALAPAITNALRVRQYFPLCVCGCEEECEERVWRAVPEVVDDK